MVRWQIDGTSSCAGVYVPWHASQVGTNPSLVFDHWLFIYGSFFPFDFHSICGIDTVCIDTSFVSSCACYVFSSFFIDSFV